jgi:hypothetical protein
MQRKMAGGNDEIHQEPCHLPLLPVGSGGP